MAGDACSIYQPQKFDTASDRESTKQEKITGSSMFRNLCLPEMKSKSYHSRLAPPIDITQRDSSFKNAKDTKTRVYTDWINTDWIIKALEKSYKFRNDDAVRTFLMEEPSAAKLLSEAYERIREYFPASEIFIEVIADPEASGEKELVVSIVTDMSPREAIERLDAFDDDWWLEASDISKADICIKVEYK